MQKKLKYNPDDMFVLLVVEPASPSGSSTSSSNGSGSPGVVGVVEVSYIGERETLSLLEPGTEGFCYVASMVVAPSWRRRGAAAALLAAAEEAAAAWDERQLLLHVYPENESALALYGQAGFEVLRQQSKPFAKTRVLMRKGW
jgi:ribosomal protein S18 acetylase RimI-like enzyme